jgi:hypothetical protein
MDPKKLKVAELRTALEERGLDTSGLKQVIPLLLFLFFECFEVT